MKESQKLTTMDDPPPTHMLVTHHTPHDMVINVLTLIYLNYVPQAPKAKPRTKACSKTKIQVSDHATGSRKGEQLGPAQHVA